MEVHPHPRNLETDEVLRCIGRNLLHFQRVEHLLKRLVVMYVPKAPVSQMAARVEKHQAKTNTSTMGALADALMERFLNPDFELKTRGELDEVRMGFHVSIDLDKESLVRHAQEMQALVDARNALVHHFLPRWSAATKGDTAAALQYLDTQLADCARMEERLREWVTAAQAAVKEHVDFMASSEGHQQLALGFLRTSSLVAMLGDAALERQRADGWVTLKAATKLIQSRAPEELAELEKRFGLPDLKAVLLRTGFFEVQDETVASGRTRTIYRIAKEWRFTPASPVSVPAATVGRGTLHDVLPVAPDGVATAPLAPAHAAVPVCAAASG